MRTLFGIALLGAALWVSGCSSSGRIWYEPWRKKSPPPAGDSAAAPLPVARSRPLDNPSPKAVIKPDPRLAGKVDMVNSEGRFAVVSFAGGSVPTAGTHLGAYRNGQKVGDLKVTGPQRDSETVADILSGDVQVHDGAMVE